MKKQWINNQIKRLFCLTAAFCLLLSGNLASVKAQTEETSLPVMKEGTIKLRTKDADIQLSYGVSGMARYGRDCLMVGTVTRGSLTGGSVEFILEDTDGGTQNYAVALSEIETGESFSIVIPMHRYLNKISVAVKNERQDVLTERVVPLQCLILGNGSTVGILSDKDNAEAYAYLSAFGNYTVVLSPEEVPEQAKGLEFFDMLVMDGCTEGSLTDAAAEALSEWIMAGGTLIVGIGDKGDRTLYSLMDLGLFDGEITGMTEIQTCYGLTDEIRTEINRSILEYESAGNQLREYITSYGDSENAGEGNEWGRGFLGESIGNFYKEEDGILYAAETVKLCRMKPTGAEAAITEAGETLLFTQPMGDGRIEWYAFPLARRNFDYYGVYLVHQMRKNQSEIGAARLERVIYDVTLDADRYTVLDSVAEQSEPKIVPYIILFLLYLVLIGPVLYLSLKKKGKGTWIFAILPVISVIFLVILYGVGQKTRITKPYVSYVEVVEEKQGTVTADLSLIAAAPTSEEWNVSLAKTAKVRLLSSSVNSFYDLSYLSLGGGTPKIREEEAGVTYGEESTVLEFTGYAPFSKVMAKVQYETELPNVIEGDIRLSDTGVDGSLNNASSVVFSQSYLYCDGVLVATGEMQPGEIINLKDQNQKVVLTGSAINLYGSEENYERRSQEDQLAREYIYSNLSGTMDNVCFIAMTKQLSTTNPIMTDNSEYTIEGGITMYISELTATNVGEKGNFEVLTDKTMQVLDGMYTPGDKYRGVSSDVLVAEYSLGTEKEVLEIGFLPFFNQEYNSYYATGWNGRIYLYNFETDGYDLLSEQYAASAVTNTESYVSKTGAIRVMYEKGQLYPDSYMELPCLTYYWKEKESSLE